MLRRYLGAVLLGVMLPSSGALAVNTPSEATSFYEDAINYFEKGDYAAAIIQLRNAVQIDPENHHARFLLGRIRLELGHPEAAEKELRSALAGQYSDETEILLGRALLDQFKFEDVIRTVSRDALSEESLNDKLLLLAEAHWGLNQPEMNQAIYRQVLEREPDHAGARLGFARLYLARNERGRAVQQVDALLAIDPEYDPGWVFRGEIALLEGETAAGMEFFRKAVEVNPDNFRARVNLAWLHLRQGDWRTAEEEALDAAHTRPRDPFARYLLAALDFARGSYDKALEKIRDVEAHLSGERPVQLLGALNHIRMGAYSSAERLLISYLNREPSDPDVRRLLGFVALRNGNALFAATTLEPLVQSRPDDTAAAQLLSSAYLVLGRHGRASRTLQAILERKATNGEAELRKTLIRLAGVAGIGNWQPEFLVSLMPADAVTALFSILSLLDQEKVDQARNEVRRLKLEFPDSPIVLTIEGIVLTRQKEPYAARSSFQRALEFEPSFVPALERLDAIDRESGNPERIESRLLQLLDRAPRSEILITRFIEHLSDAERFEELEEFLVQKRAIMVNSILLARALIVLQLAQKNVTEVLQILEEILIVSAEVPADLRYAHSLFLALDRPDRALFTASLLEALEPASTDPLLLRAAAEARAGNPQDAIGSLERAWDISPGNKVVARELTNLFIALSDPAKALAIAKRLEPYDQVAAAKLESNVLFRTGQQDLAVESLEQAFNAYPVSALARDLFVARSRTGRDEAGIEGLREWLAGRPDDLESRFLLANSFMQQGSYQAALEEYRHLVELTADDPLVLNNLAWLTHHLGGEGALDLASRAYSLSPASAAIADTYGWILVQNDQPQEGIKVLRSAAELETGPQSGLRYRLAVALASVGEDEEARALLRGILESAAPFPERQEAETLLKKLGREKGL